MLCSSPFFILIWKNLCQMITTSLSTNKCVCVGIQQTLVAINVEMHIFEKTHSNKVDTVKFLPFYNVTIASHNTLLLKIVFLSVLSVQQYGVCFFNFLHPFSAGNRSALHRPVQYAYPLPSQPCLCKVWGMWFYNILLLKEMFVAFKISGYFSALMLPL